MNKLVEKNNEIVAHPEPVTPASMLQIALEKGASIEQMQQLMDLQDRWEANQAKKAYVQAMTQFRSKCPAIEKTRKAHNSMYAGLAETLQTIKGLLSECGLSHSWRTGKTQDGLIEVTCCVTHISGHSECTSLAGEPDKSGSKNSIQAVASTVSYLERYTLYALLGLASKDMDTDANPPKQLITEEQALNMEALADEVGADKKKFLQYWQVKNFNEFSVKQYTNAMKSLEAKRK